MKRREIPAIPAVQAMFYNFLNAIKIAVEENQKELDQVGTRLESSEKLQAGFTNKYTVDRGVFTPKKADGLFQLLANKGAHTLAPPITNCVIIMNYVNTSTAGTITTSGFTQVTGTAPTTTSGHKFFGRITVFNGLSWLEWQALQ